MASKIVSINPTYLDFPLKPRRERLWLAEEKKCHWCGCPTRLGGDVWNWDCATIDHIIPRYKGGSNEEFNVVSACARCNNRRNHEDMCGLPEGALLGKWKMDSTTQSTNIWKPKLHRSALSGDEKRTLMARMDIAKLRIPAVEIVKEQRDQSLKRIIDLQKEVESLKATIQELETMPIIRIARRKLGRLLLDIKNQKR